MQAAVKSAEAAIPKIIVKKTVHAKAERAFDAWTKPELMQRWFFPKGWTAKTTNDLRVGGSYSHDMISDGSAATCASDEKTPLETAGHHMHKGEYLEIRRPERLVFTWSSHSVQNTRVTVDFRDLGDATEITITHELLSTEQQRQSHTGGWGECLESLAAFLG